MSFPFEHLSHEYLSVAKEILRISRWANLRPLSRTIGPAASSNRSILLHPRREEVHARCTRAHTRARACVWHIVSCVCARAKRAKKHGSTWIRFPYIVSRD